jgi:hypothetical protein
MRTTNSLSSQPALGPRTDGEVRIPRHVHARLERIGVWLVLPFCFAYLLGVGLVARMIPPPGPGLSAEEIAHIYASGTMRIRIAFSLLLFTGLLTMGLVAVLVRHLRRIEGHWGVLTISQLGVGVMLPLVVWLPLMFAEVAAFRPERSPEITQMLNDCLWLFALALVGGVVVQALILAVATFLDGGAEPIFPRWFGYLNLWYAVLAIPGGTIYFFHSGPMAWTGVVGFWIPIVAFFVWVVSMMRVLFQAIDREYAS